MVRLFGLRRPPATETRVAVIGSGLAVSAVALELARGGLEVAVFAREDVEPPMGLLLLGPGLLYARVIAERGREAAREIWAAGRENHERLRGFLGEARRDCGHRPRGSFVLAADRDEAQALAEGEDLLRDDGFAGEFLDHYMLETRFDLRGFKAGYWAEEGGDVDAIRLATLLRRAVTAHGAVRRDEPLRGLEVGPAGAVVHTEGGSVRAERLVVATDHGAATLLPTLLSPLRSRIGSRLRLSVAAGARLPGAAQTADGTAAWQESGRRLQIAGLRAPDQGPESLEARVEALAGVLPLVPESRSAFGPPEETTADGLPLVGELEGSPVSLACGFGPLAASYVFAAAHWIAEAMAGRTDPTPPPLRLARVLPPRGGTRARLGGGRGPE
jgi:gamma-glutamylputrescine oxidase